MTEAQKDKHRIANREFMRAYRKAHPIVDTLRCPWCRFYLSSEYHMKYPCEPIHTKIDDMNEPIV